MSRVNKTIFSVQHESCGCKCRLSESVCRILKDITENWVVKIYYKNGKKLPI